MNRTRKNADDERAVVNPAVHWFIRLRDDDSPPLEADELQEWERFAAEAAQRRELGEVAEVWEAVHTLGGPRMPTEAELSADDFDGSESVSRWKARRSSGRGKYTSSRSLRWLVAASLAGLIVAMGNYQQPWFDWRPQKQIQAFATPVAEHREVKLADGSVVTIGARTEIQTRITATERTIVLDRGEAWFNVAHETRRPFRVIAGSGVITAVGTEFNVRRDLDFKGDRVTVTVGAGAVNVAPRVIAEQDRRSWKPALLVKGQELAYDRAGVQGEVRRADIEAAAAWKEGRLEYIHQPLSSVLVQVNRYSGKPIVLGDEAAGEIDFSGTVFEGQIDDWVRALQNAFPITVTESEDRILIRSRDSG